MRSNLIRGVVSALVLAASPLVSQAGISIGVSVNIAPPALPVYVQPPCPGVGYIWTPGYWAWDGDDYYWVPGTWVLAPAVGLLWTPGYWGWSEGVYVWHAGYWGPHVGFYGGINYGYGYTGVGFAGGYWHGHDFFYNRSVTNITNVHITNVYNKTVINNVTVNHVSFNGGQGGVMARPTPGELRAEHEHHVAFSPMQRQHEQMAEHNRELRASINGGKPSIAATARPAMFTGRGVVAARAAGGPHPGGDRPGGMGEHQTAQHGAGAGPHGPNLHGAENRGGDVRGGEARAGDVHGAGPHNGGGHEPQMAMRTDRPPGAQHAGSAMPSDHAGGGRGPGAHEPQGAMRTDRPPQAQRGGGDAQFNSHAQFDRPGGGQHAEHGGSAMPQQNHAFQSERAPQSHDAAARMSPPHEQQRMSAPHEQPHMTAPREQPHMSAPREQPRMPAPEPHMSAPREQARMPAPQPHMSAPPREAPHQMAPHNEGRGQGRQEPGRRF